MSKTKTELKFSIGCDPELMLVNGKGELISAIPLIKGTKEAPQVFKDDEDKADGMVSHDNVMIEYGTKPAQTEDEFVSANSRVLKRIVAMLPADVKMVVQASATYPLSQLQDEEAKIFGCDPDFNPYEMEVNEIDPKAPLSPFRTCGGHIHVGHQKVADEIETLVSLAKAYDAFLAIPFMLLSKDPTSVKRRSLYGKAGAHRPKPYGLEYRTVDNYWVSSPDLTRLAYRLTRDGLKAVLNGHLEGLNEDAIREIVNKGDLTAATTTFNSFVRRLIGQDTLALFNTLMEAPRPDLYKEWGL